MKSTRELKSAPKTAFRKTEFKSNSYFLIDLKESPRIIPMGHHIWSFRYHRRLQQAWLVSIRSREFIGKTGLEV